MADLVDIDIIFKRKLRQYINKRMERFYIYLFYILLPINVFSLLPLNKHLSSLKMSSIESNNNNNNEATNDHLNSLYKGMSQLTTSSTSTLNNNRQLPSPLNLIVDFNILRNSVVYEVSLGM